MTELNEKNLENVSGGGDDQQDIEPKFQHAENPDDTPGDGSGGGAPGGGGTPIGEDPPYSDVG